MNRLFIAFLFVLLTCYGAFAAELILTWTAIDGAEGYRISYGLTPGTLDQTLDVLGVPASDPGKLKHTVVGLDVGVDYFFKILAHSGDVESELSSGVFGMAKLKTPILGIGE